VVFLVDKNGQLIASSVMDRAPRTNHFLASLTAGKIAATGGLAKADRREKDFDLSRGRGATTCHISIVAAA